MIGPLPTSASARPLSVAGAEILEADEGKSFTVAAGKIAEAERSESSQERDL
ncbi:hypothetical protein HFO63_34930 [Rhizobium laguerreae]|uniref:hypothetical protein n=1 Tax=Rhizobium laguerreae TaxID=1076926 RepID=UPI001C92013E|nr:hypothetical protein [Rhizobium laguerreae]MBY3088610.1 hypothetical protein [Rhizobium laguerreae]MBY3150674.1 hypothetical protein [Rhizobium laguerreae]